MEEIAIIRDRSKLKGTCYIEIVPGKYQKKHWQEGSLFFDEEVFGLIEPIFESYINGYNHYSMNDASKTEWIKIIDEIVQLNELLKSSAEFDAIVGKVGFISVGTRGRFQTNFEESKKSLIEMNQALISWVRDVLSTHEHIAVLGI